MLRQRNNYPQSKRVQTVPRKTVALKQPQERSFQQNIKIFLRIKPNLDKEATQQSIKILNKKQVEVIPPYYYTDNDRIYRYEEVYGPTTTNSQIFQRTMLQPIHNVLSGFNSTVFIYGMTGAGKTYTMFNDQRNNTENEGIIHCTLAKLFEQSKNNKQNQHQIKLSFFQIYNENIRDLLSDNKESLIILQNPAQGVVINELKEIIIQSKQAADFYIEEGIGRRVREATKNNEVSSRSHAIIQIAIKKITQIEDTNQVYIQQSKLFLIDLAGNEKTWNNQNKRFVEGVNINKSLLTLGKCINILSENKKTAFIPYRDSKLTRILKDSLGGNCKTVMIACVSAESKFYEQTVNTLKYSSKAQRIKNKGKGCSVKKMSIKELSLLPVSAEESPDVGLEDEEKIFSFVNSMETILKDKIRIELVKEELEQCLVQCQQEFGGVNNQRISEIKNTLSKIKSKHGTVLQQLDDEIKSFVGLVSALKKIQSTLINQQLVKPIKNKENSVSNKFSRGMNRQKIAQAKQVKTEAQQQNSQDIMSNVLPICLSQNQLNDVGSESYQVSIHQTFSKKEEHPKNLSIKIQSCRNSNKENIHFNGMKRSSASPSSINSEKAFNYSKSNRALPRQTIDITKQNFKLQSPTMKSPILICSQSSQKFGTNPDTKLQKFLVRLKQMDMNASSIKHEILVQLLEQFDREGYEIGRMQKCMLSKLRFMTKNREKQISAKAEGSKNLSKNKGTTMRRM